MRGLMAKTLREVWVFTSLFALALFGVEVALAFILNRFQRDLAERLLQLEFVRGVITALLGAELGSTIGPDAINSMAWAHPIVLALVWSHAIIFATRLPAGEVDRGTIDVLLGLPVSRTRLYLCESAVWLAGALLLVCMALLGNVLGRLWVGAEAGRILGRLLLVSVNLCCLYLVVGSVAWLVSALSDRRGRAIGAVFGMLLALFLLNSLVPFWETARQVAFLNPLNYYRPLLILRDGAVPIADVLVLLGVGAAFWAGGAVAFSRRDICTV